MIPACQDIDIFLIDAIDQAVFIVDPPAPETGQVAMQRFRFSDAGISVSLYILDQFIDPFERLPILRLPIDVILPSMIGKQLIHLRPQSKSLPSPCPFATGPLTPSASRNLPSPHHVNILDQVVVGLFRHQNHVFILFAGHDQCLVVVGESIQMTFHVASEIRIIHCDHLSFLLGSL